MLYIDSHNLLYGDEIHSVTLTLEHIMWMPGIFIPIFLLPMYFPTGTLLSSKWRFPVAVIVANLLFNALTVIVRPWPWETFGILDTRVLNGIAGVEIILDPIWQLFSAMSTPFIFSSFVAFLIRFRRSTGVERTQMKWSLTAIMFILTFGFAIFSIPGVIEFEEQYGYVFTWSLAMLFPISIGIAILRHSLFDIDVVFNRTLVYGILTGLIIALYIAIVSFLGILVQAQTSVLSGLIATGIIAVIFQPLRERVQKTVSRYIYGQRDEPEIIFSKLAQHLETSDAPSTILPNLVQTIAQALKIPYVAILVIDDSNNLETFAEFGNPPEQCEMIALNYNNHVIGQLVASSRSQQEQFTKQERSLLNTIAALTATTVRSVQLAEELRQSRQRIVTAREEERRRIRRDLHDGLGPALAAHMIQIGSARALAKGDPETTEIILEELEVDLEQSLGNIRRLVYNLRPPVLDQLGLTAALRDFIQQCNQSTDGGEVSFKLIVPSELPALPAAVEVAAYRIVQEAINNVIRHAHAQHTSIHLECDDAFRITIEDDGIGFPAQVIYGVGLNSMRERTEELGGRFKIRSHSKNGTLIFAELPVDGVTTTI